jgi:recombination protein RecA
MMTAEDKSKKINNILEKINKKYGKGSLSIASNIAPFGTHKTPFPTVNNLCGGIPIGRFTTIAGPEHTGKGVFCLQLIAFHQQQDPEFIAMWSDAENSFDETWAETLGVDLDRLIIQRYTSDVSTMERLLDEALDIIRELEVNLWVVDSIGALVPKADIIDNKGKDRPLEEANMLNLQRKMGEFYRKANIIIAPREDKPGCAVILIGQVYTVPSANVTLHEVRGGNAVKHWAHLRLMFRRGPRSEWPEKVKLRTPDGIEREVHPGWSGRIKVDKSRVNPNEQKEILLTFVNGRGFNSNQAVIIAALGHGLIERRGAYYKSDLLPGGQIQGKEATIEFFKSNPEAFKMLYEKVNNLALEHHLSSEDSATEE